MLRMFNEQQATIVKEFNAFEASFWENVLETSLSLFRSRDSIEEQITSLVERMLTLGAERQQFDLELFGISFELSNPLAIAFLENYGANLITEVSNTTRERVRRITTLGLEEGLAWTEITQQIKQAFTSFSRQRAKLIAVTEIGNAYQEGNMELAQSSGFETEKRWVTVGDSRVTELCKQNEQQGWIPLDQAFASGHMRPLRFPGCRCVASYRLA